MLLFFFFFFFFFNDPATTEIYTLSLHDALPISPSPTKCCCERSSTVSRSSSPVRHGGTRSGSARRPCSPPRSSDRKSTRLNSSHVEISYAVFCLKKKKNKKKEKKQTIKILKNYE